MFAKAPLIISGFPSYSFWFAKAPDADALATSLAEVLSTWRIFAGRFRKDGKAIVLCDAGVRFTVRQGEPNDDHEAAVWKSSDIIKQGSMVKGNDPVMTVVLTQFPGGAGMVTISRSHGVADGSSFADFLADWIKVAKGKTPEPVAYDRTSKIKIGTLEEAVADASAEIGRPIKPNSMILRLILRLMPLIYRVERFKLSRGKPLQTRHRMFFSNSELNALKAHATAGIKSVPWITTQEAFVAHLVQVIPTFLGKGPRVGVLLWLDGRRFAGLKRTCTGTGLALFAHVFETKGKALGELAEEFQLALKKFGPEVVGQWKAGEEGQEYLLDKPVGPPYAWRLAKCDHVLMLNNQSKIPLLDVGTGPAESAASTSGPTLFVPHPDGLEAFFDGGTLPIKPEQKAAIEVALHNIPKAA